MGPGAGAPAPTIIFELPKLKQYSARLTQELPEVSKVKFKFREGENQYNEIQGETEQK